jgi:hypothetical protein
MEDREVRHTVDERETGFNLKRKRDTTVSNKSTDSTYAHDSDLTDGLMEARGLVEDGDHEISRLPHKDLVHGMDPLKHSEIMPRILRKGPCDHCGATTLIVRLRQPDLRSLQVPLRLLVRRSNLQIFIST